MEKYIKQLLHLSKKAYKKNEVPIGCLIIENDKIISKAYNKKQKTHKCIDHAEILAITKAAKKKKDWRLNDCELYVTLEPCDMCKEVIRQSRINKVYYIIKSNFNNEKNKKINLVNLKVDASKKSEFSEVLSNFFVNKR